MEQTLLMDSLRCEQLWRRHADRLLLYATTVLSDRSAAEDALQNVFVRLMASPPEEIDSEAGYLFRAVRNEALNSIRSRRLAARAFSPLFDDVAEDPRESAEVKERGRQVEQVLLRLDPEEREAVVLKIWGDLSMPEAAAVAGVTGKIVWRNSAPRAPPRRCGTASAPASLPSRGCRPSARTPSRSPRRRSCSSPSTPSCCRRPIRRPRRSRRGTRRS